MSGAIGISKTNSKFAGIRKRLQQNKLTSTDIKQLEKIIVSVEDAVAKLRATIIE